MSGEERQLYFGLAAIAAALLATIWLIGALAGLAFGGGWTSIGLSELVTTALSLPSHLGDPRAAWPRGARPGEMPVANPVENDCERVCPRKAGAESGTALRAPWRLVYAARDLTRPSRHRKGAPSCSNS